jgi:cytochrome d ubiquinol oxidase subunit II
MATVWIALILLCLLMYVSLDGYDLGLGVISLVERDRRRRRELLEQVAQAWDGNETWLVLLAVSLWAGFPLVFGTILPRAYLPLIIMLFSLIIRGVSVEMASQARATAGWERAFGMASLTAALAQGIALGTLAAPLTVVDGAFSGSPFGAIGWFSLLTAAAVLCGYLALGYGYLRWKATGELRATAGRRGAVSTAVASVLVAACVVALNGTAASPNLGDPDRAIGFAVLLVLAAAGVVVALVTLRPTSRHDGLPTAGLVTTIVATVLAISLARYPELVPGLTVADTVAPSATMVFLAVGIGINVPLILFYNWFAHHAFRGKLDTGPGSRELPNPRLRSQL